jgi:hypothetical protein
MRNKLTVFIVASIILPVLASEKPPESYQKAMKSIQASTTKLRSDVKDIKYDELQKDALDLREGFMVALEYWKEKKADDAIKLAQDGIKATQDLEAAAKAQNYQNVMQAQNSISGGNNLAFTGVGAESLPGVCVGCHLAHRQRMPDGTFEIK